MCAYVLRLAPIDTAADDGGGTVGKNACDAFRVRAVSCRELRQRAFDLSRRVFDIPNYSRIDLSAIDYRRIRNGSLAFARLNLQFILFTRFYPFHAAKLFPLNRAAVRNNLIHYARLPRLVIFNAAIYTVCTRMHARPLVRRARSHI